MPGAHRFRGYCLLSLPRRSGSGRATLSVTIRSTSASGNSRSCPTSSLRWHAPWAASLPTVFPSLHTPALGPEWWDHIFWALLAVKRVLATNTYLHTPASSPHTFASWLSCLSYLWFPSGLTAAGQPKKIIGGDKAKDGREMGPFCRNHLSRDFNFLKSQFSGPLVKCAGSSSHFQDSSSSHFSLHHQWQDGLPPISRCPAGLGASWTPPSVGSVFQKLGILQLSWILCNFLSWRKVFWSFNINRLNESFFWAIGQVSLSVSFQIASLFIYR